MRLILISFWLTLAVVTEAQSDVSFNDCGLPSYYSGLPNDIKNWNREILHDLVTNTHRNDVQFTNNIDPGINDVWGALMDVDEGDIPGTIRLIYSDEEIPRLPFGERGWVRDHLFPIVRGVDFTGPDWTDIHNIRAGTPLSTVVAGDAYFGECGVFTQPDTCVQPAEGSAEGSCSCNRVYTPPPSVRGDIARALMYMDIRYDGTESLTRDLRLTDCPFQPERDMAYLSQMLTWHAEDPPDERELIRNNRVCGNWQGNRNPFVDFPELAQQLWGQPLPLPAVGERLTYEACEAIPTLAPTTTANECDMYDEGDFVIWIMNSQEPATVGFYSFAPMVEGFELFITDNPFDGEKFLEGLENEGTMKFTTPAGGLRGGSLFGFGEDYFPQVDQFEVVEGNFTPAAEGEPLFLYCIGSNGDQRPLLVFNYGGDLEEPTLLDYAENQTALPDDFPEEGIINLPHFENLLYSGQGLDDLATDALRIAVRDPANWEGSNKNRYGVESSANGITLMTMAAALVATALLTLI